jgi:hypothetical protein
MVIEAKLLGCKLILNENVQHKDEPWFATENLEEIFQYLSDAPSRFWNAVNAKRKKEQRLVVIRRLIIAFLKNTHLNNVSNQC